jgi:beta-lactamase class A
VRATAVRKRQYPGSMPDLQSAIERSAVGESEAVWSISVIDVASGAALAELGPDICLSTASIGKLIALIELAERASRGEADLQAIARRSDADRVADSGLWQHLVADELCLADVAMLIGAVSDNLATNVLLRYLGLEAVHRRGELLGLEHSRLHDRVRDQRTADDPPRLSSGTARELAQLMRWLAWDEGSPMSPGVRGLVLSWLVPGTDLSMVASAFGLDPLAHAGRDRGIRLWNKTGTNVGVRADVGIVEGPGRRVAYAVLVNWSEQASISDRSRDVVLDGMRQIGEALRGVVAPRGARSGR